jgi:hypothetical protein
MASTLFRADSTLLAAGLVAVVFKVKVVRVVLFAPILV